jgi:hypothetical protein
LDIQIPLWQVLVALGVVLVLSIAVNGWLVYRLCRDKDLKVLSLQLAQHKSTLELNTFSNNALAKILDELFGKPKPLNGG